LACTPFNSDTTQMSSGNNCPSFSIALILGANWEDLRAQYSASGARIAS
jgi:hypothetical protein